MQANELKLSIRRITAAVVGGYAILVLGAAAAHAQVQPAKVSGLPAATVPTTVKVYTLLNEEEGDTVYTDRKGCIVRVTRAFLDVEADSSANMYERVQVLRLPQDKRPAGWVNYFAYEGSRHYNLTRESDLINRQCTAMLKSIPNDGIKKLLAHVIVE